jgi:hypothetical protein
MEELIKLKNKIKEYDLEKLLNCLISYSKELECMSSNNKREELKEMAEKKVFLIKLEIMERYNKEGVI